MLLEPNPTPYDLNFYVFRTPVRVHPSFWLFSAILGWGFIREGFGYLLLWIGCTFLSILVHELGHVFMGKAFGRPGQIVLYSFGGLAIGSYNLARRWQRILVSFAGPAAGFLLFGVALGARFGLRHMDLEINPEIHRVLVMALFMLLWMNLVWNLLNLLPVWPLDGGHISRDFFSGISPRNGLRISLGFSFLLSALIAVYSLICTYQKHLPYPPVDPIFSVILFGLLAVQSYQMLQEADRGPWNDRDW